MPKFNVSALPSYYLRVHIEFTDKDVRLDATQLRTLCTAALTKLFGQIGAAAQVDVLGFDPASSEGVLRTTLRDAVRLQSALTLLPAYLDKPVRAVVRQQSSHLMDLALTSRAGLLG
eukprot:m.253152 g.253152  ORF g.253152 m.253152 type:complete len:117 (+) comp18165_c0_seq1:32-382(+)